MEIFVRSYQDSNGDGIGDFKGLTSRLDYLKSLGVTGIWLMPIMPSGDHDHGYAVSDYRAIDPDYGTMQDFETFEGYEARLELDRLAEGRKRFRGVLAGIEDDHVAIDLEGEDDTAMIPFAWVVEAKLVLTDALMKRGAEARARNSEDLGGDEDEDFGDDDYEDDVANDDEED